MEWLALACAYGRGYRLVRKNYWCRAGEIDLIVCNDAWLVFVEVRYRARSTTRAIESVDAAKQRRLIAAAATFLSHAPSKLTTLAVRFDMVAITAGYPKLVWVEDAFSDE